MNVVNIDNRTNFKGFGLVKGTPESVRNLSQSIKCDNILRGLGLDLGSGFFVPPSLNNVSGRDLMMDYLRVKKGKKGENLYLFGTSIDERTIQHLKVIKKAIKQIIQKLSKEAQAKGLVNSDCDLILRDNAFVNTLKKEYYEILNDAIEKTPIVSADELLALRPDQFDYDSFRIIK